MARKAVTEGGKSDEIITAAMECFLEKGFDGTSVRTIMKKAGGEIGLFYYYFENKNAVFDKVLDRFFAGYQKDFAEIVKNAYRDPFRAMTNFFEYMKAGTNQFREQYAENIHRTVRWAIREQTMTIIAPYIRQIVRILVHMGAATPLNLDTTSMMLAYGVGSMIIHEDSEWMERSTADIKKAVHLLMGLDASRADLMFPYFPTAEDVTAIGNLAEEMKAQFPGFSRTQFETQLKQRIHQQEAFVIRQQDEIAGCILFSYERQEIDFLGVAPDYQRQGVAMRLLTSAMAQFPAGTELSVVTYQENDPMGIAVRCFYRKYGFQEGELVTVFDYPCQRMTGIAPDCLPPLKEIRES